MNNDTLAPTEKMTVGASAASCPTQMPPLVPYY